MYDSMQEIPYLSRLTWSNRGAKWTPGSVVLREARGHAGERGSLDCRHARRGGERQPRLGSLPRTRSGAGAGGGAEARIDSAVMTLARLIGRRIAREELDRLDAANHNAPGKDAGEK